MKNQYSRMDNICPKEPKKLRIPDQIDLYMEDGTVYHVRSFFAGDLVMGDMDQDLFPRTQRRHRRISGRYR